MVLRILTAIVLIPAALLLIYFSSPLQLLFALGVLGTICLWEYLQIIRKIGLRPQPTLGYLTLWGLWIGLYSGRIPSILLIAGVVVLGFLAGMWGRDELRQRVSGMMANVFGVLYIGLFLYPAVPLRHEFGDERGLHWILLLLTVIWSGDIAAMFAGRWMGRTPLAPVLSPKKTLEGAIAGLVGGCTAAVCLQIALLQSLPMLHVVGVSVLLGVAGQLGDLSESFLKRAAGVKDSSNLIPGHGGLLDRIDSLIFAIPVLYVYLILLYGI